MPRDSESLCIFSCRQVLANKGSISIWIKLHLRQLTNFTKMNVDLALDLLFGAELPDVKVDDTIESLLKNGSPGGATVNEVAQKLDFAQSPEDVLERIELAVLWMDQQLIDGSELPDLKLVSTNQTGRIASLKRSGSASARFARALAVMRSCHQLVSTRSTITQRSLWYHLKTNPMFHSTSHISEAIQDIVSLLLVPRSLLGIVPSSKGLAAGSLVITDNRSNKESDLSVQGGTWSIPGDIGAIKGSVYQSDAVIILIIEKESIFQQLMEQQLFRKVPTILVTGKGYPDLATRAFIHNLHEAFPHMLLLALVDWNPSGVAIASLYKYGSADRMMESTSYALANLRWLGARANMLEKADGDVFQPLTLRDISVADTLCTTLSKREPEWAEELSKMRQIGYKAELEAVCSMPSDTFGLADVLLQCIEAGDFA